MSQGSQQNRLFVTSNRRTPSTKTHINSLPSELLRHIFWFYCSLRYRPLPLLLVCRLWHTIASDCSALWASIYYNPQAYYYRTTQDSISKMELRRKVIFCDTWAEFQWAVERARTAPLTLYFGFVDTCGHRERQGSEMLFLTRCRELSLRPPGTAVAFLNNLPALEHLEFYQPGKTEVDQLFRGIEQGSPLLWSLTLRGMWSLPCLAHLSTLLGRIRCLDVDLNPRKCNDQFLMGLRNLTELTFYGGRSLQIPRLAFPKLLSLTIWNTQLVVDENMEFPVLDRLTLHEDWSSLPLIVAPKLTKLVLGCEKTPRIPLPTLLRATVQPTSLVLFYPPLDIELPELLTMWSGLLELHLKYNREVNVARQVELATLGGNSDRGRLCPHLRYLTVHVNHGQRDPTVNGQIIQTLHTIVEERKRYDNDELRRVTCVWEDRSVSNEYVNDELQRVKCVWEDRSVSYTEHVHEPTEIEWVDVL